MEDVQYCGGCSILWWDIICTEGGTIISTVRHFCIAEDIQCCFGISSALWLDTIISTVRDVQYCGGVFSIVEGVQHCGGCSQ